jgi:hypothetical protein
MRYADLLCWCWQDRIWYSRRWVRECVQIKTYSLLAPCQGHYFELASSSCCQILQQNNPLPFHVVALKVHFTPHYAYCPTLMHGRLSLLNSWLTKNVWCRVKDASCRSVPLANQYLMQRWECKCFANQCLLQISDSCKSVPDAAMRMQVFCKSMPLADQWLLQISTWCSVKNASGLQINSPSKSMPNA